VREQVKFIHYMGKSKPWDEREDYKYQLGKFYFETQQEAEEKLPHLYKEVEEQYEKEG